MREPPYRFRLLGGVGLHRPDGSSVRSVLAQPRRVALLAYVTVEGDGGFVARDRIMSVLWPESDTSRARQSLRNALYQVRRSLSEGVLVNRGAAEIGVDAGLLSVDVLKFRKAVSEGRFLEAATLYRGPFLSGFHLGEGLEFEDWRSRLEATLHGDALWALREAAREQERAGDVEAARSLLRRAQDMAPRDEEILRRRLHLLSGQGNRAAAIAEGEGWIETLRSTLGVDPSEATLELLHELRSDASRRPGGSSRPADDQPPTNPSPPPPGAPAAPLAPGALASGPRLAALERGAETVSVRHALRRSPGGVGRRPMARWVVWPAALIAMALVLVDQPAPLPSTDRGVIIQRFEADSTVGGEAAGLALGVLTARLLEAGGGGVVLPPEGVSAASQDGVARRLVSGSLRGDGKGLVAEITLASTLRPGDVLARASAEIDGFDLETLAVRLVDELAGRSGRALASSVAVPPLTTVPGAVLPFFEGEIFAQAGRRPEAREAYERALMFDSTFAMASFRLSMLLESIGLRDKAIVVSDRAVALSATMTEGERRRLDAWRAYEWGNVEQALPMFEALAASRAPDPDIWLTLAEIRFHWGPQLGVPRQEADSAFRALLGVTPDNVDALQHLVRLMGPVSSTEEIGEIVGRLIDLGAPEDVLMEARAISALSHRRPLDGRVAEWVTDGTFALESRRLTQLAASARVPWDLAPFIRELPPTEEPRRRVLRRLLLAQLAAASGRMREAHEELDALAATHPDRALEYRILLELSSAIRPSADDLGELRSRLRSLPDSRGPRHALMEAVAASGLYGPRAIVLDAMLTRGLGEPIDSAAVMARGRGRPEEFVPEYWRHVVVEILGATASHERILGVMGPGRPEGHGSRPDPLSYLAGTSRWARIRSLLALGRDEEALRWLQTFPDVGGYDLVYVAQASLLSGRILERYGRRSEAASAYRRAAQLWERADPEFDRLVAQAREGLERTGPDS